MPSMGELTLVNDIKKILLERSKTNTLAHFYILRAPYNCKNHDQYLQEWMDDFLLSFISLQKNCSHEIAQKSYQFDIADFLTLRKQSDRKQYLVEDLAALFRFVELRPFEFKTKIVIITQAHLIEKKISNKLLKLLEEPTDNTTIFFLYGTHSKALNTIESRGINIQLIDDLIHHYVPPSSIQNFFQTTPTSKLASKLQSFLQSSASLSELLDFIYKKKDYEPELIATITQLFQLFPKKFHSSESFLTQLKIYEKAKLLNMPLKTRIFPLLQLVKRNFSI